MMNKRIRSMIDDIFAEMKMTAENLALRDELMANAQARFEDSVRQGKTEEEAFAEVAASLGDVHALLREMNAAGDAQGETAGETGSEADEETAGDERAAADAQPDGEPGEEPGTRTQENSGCAGDLGDALNKAFSALGDFGKQIMPQTKKFVRDVDQATGGVILDLGKAVNKGMRDAQKAAGEAIDKLSGEKGELVFDFGKREEQRKARTAEEMREEAQDLRAQAEIKRVTNDQEGADALCARADELETQADALDQAQAMEDARRAAEQEAGESAGASAPLTDENGEVDEEAFARAVDEMAREAEEAAKQTPDYTVRDAGESVSGRQAFSAAGLHAIDIQLDADDVYIQPADDGMVETVWSAQNVDGAPVVTMDGHTLTIRRRNPDVFKTFFSVFKKEGGRITVRVPRGYAADYKISTTSGDIRLRDLDVDDVKINTTSGDVRVEPDAGIRAKVIDVTTVSGSATVSACAGDVKVVTVSGNQFVSCDAGKVDVSVVSGKVHIEGACEEWEANSVSGDVEMLCTVAPTRKIQIATMSGSARVALPDEIRGFVAEVSGISGAIVNEFGPNRYGTCALPIHMDTMSGKLMITRL